MTPGEFPYRVRTPLGEGRRLLEQGRGAQAGRRTAASRAHKLTADLTAICTSQTDRGLSRLEVTRKQMADRSVCGDRRDGRRASSPPGPASSCTCAENSTSSSRVRQRLTVGAGEVELDAIVGAQDSPDSTPNRLLELAAAPSRTAWGAVERELFAPVDRGRLVAAADRRGDSRHILRTARAPERMRREHGDDHS